MKKYIAAISVGLIVLAGVATYKVQPAEYQCHMTYESSPGSKIKESGVIVKDNGLSFTIETLNHKIESGWLKTAKMSNKNIKSVKYSENDPYTFQAKTTYSDNYVNYTFKRGQTEYTVHDCKKI